MFENISYSHLLYTHISPRATLTLFNAHTHTKRHVAITKQIPLPLPHALLPALALLTPTHYISDQTAITLKQILKSMRCFVCSSMAMLFQWVNKQRGLVTVSVLESVTVSGRAVWTNVRQSPDDTWSMTQCFPV